MTKDVFYALATLLLVLIQSFAMYLPVRALLKDKATALRFAIPTSLSVQIIIGYIFYLTSAVRYFPASYFLIAILLNVWAYFKLRPIKIRKPKINITIAAVLLITSAVILYTRFYDGFKFAGPGGLDTYSHIIFVRDLFTRGFLHNGYYAPGFHLLMMPISKVVPLYLLYRFAGPAIGVSIIISFVLLIKDQLKNKILLILLLTLLICPLYNLLILQTINFFSSALSFIFFACFIALLSNWNGKTSKVNLLFAGIFSIALALTVPYFFIALISGSLIILFVVVIFNKRLKANLSYLVAINFIFLFGLIISFAHVYIQSNILKRYYGFPGIATVQYYNEEETDEPAPGEIVANGKITEKFHLPVVIKENAFLKPMIGTAYDVFKIKYVRSSKTLLGIGAYLWIALSLVLLIYSLRKKNSLLISIAIFSLLFGVSVQTGFLEMSVYRGRSGWYLMMLSIFGLVLIADQFYTKKMFGYILTVFFLVSVSAFIIPPKFERPYFDEEFKIIRKIYYEQNERELTIISTVRSFAILSENITVLPLERESLQNGSSLLILDNVDKVPPSKKERIKDANLKIIADENFGKFKKYFENKDFTIYEKILN